MTDTTKFGMSCSEFEQLLSDALDGVLSAGDQERFTAHAAACSSCGPLYQQAEAGMKMLAGMVEVEPPRNLVRNILAVTSGREPVHERAARSWGERLGEWGIPGRIRAALVPVYMTVRQPRFAMSFGMVFFSFAMMLNIFGIKITDVKKIDLRPAAIRTAVSNGYYQTSARIVRYYDNLKFVMEMRSRLRDMQGTEQPSPEQQRDQQQQQQPKENRDTSGNPAHQNSNQGQSGPMASVIDNNLALPDRS